MNFNGHLIGGCLTSLTLVGGLHLTGDLRFAEPLYESGGDFPRLSDDVLTAAELFGTSLFMSLFPDLDTDSIIQRWYYRVLLIATLVLIYFDLSRSALCLLLLSILPLMGKHRGWTHMKISPFLTALLLPPIFSQIFRSGFEDFPEYLASGDFKAILRFYVANFLFCLAIFVGHVTHLLLDSKIFQRK